MAYHELGAQSNENGGDNERQHGHKNAQLRLLFLIVRFLQLHILRVFARHGGGHLADLRDTTAGITFVHLLPSLLHLGAGGVVDLRVGLELEKQIAAVNDQ